MTSTGPTNRARTIINSLTTTFTPGPSCVVGIAQCPVSCSQAWLAQECEDNSGGAQDATSCWPPASSGAPSPPTPFYGWGFYSPGLVCPSGYYPACTATASGVSQWPVAFSMLDGETAIGCCPSSGSTSYTCADNGYGVQTCRQFAGYGDSFAIATCESGSSQGYSYMTIPYITTATLDTSSSSQAVEAYSYASYVLFAPMIQINWQSSDRKHVTSPTSAASLIAGSQTPSPGGLSTGAKVAVGVVVPVVVLAALLGAIMLWRRHRRRPALEGNDTIRDVNNATLPKQELQGDQVHEMEEHRNTQEMEDPGFKNTRSDERYEMG